MRLDFNESTYRPQTSDLSYILFIWYKCTIFNFHYLCSKSVIDNIISGDKSFKCYWTFWDNHCYWTFWDNHCYWTFWDNHCYWTFWDNHCYWTFRDSVTVTGHSEIITLGLITLTEAFPNVIKLLNQYKHMWFSCPMSINKSVM